MGAAVTTGRHHVAHAMTAHARECEETRIRACHAAAAIFRGKLAMTTRPLLAAALLISVSAFAQDRADTADARPKLMFLGLSPGPRVLADDTSAIGNALQTEVSALNVYSVTGQSEIR